MKPQQRTSKTLKQFVKDQKRKVCAVCKLAAEIKEQIRGAADARIKAETVIEWIKEEVGMTVTVEELNKHKSERHDSA